MRRCAAIFLAGLHVNSIHTPVYVSCLAAHTAATGGNSRRKKKKAQRKLHTSEIPPPPTNEGESSPPAVKIAPPVASTSPASSSSSSNAAVQQPRLPGKEKDRDQGSPQRVLDAMFSLQRTDTGDVEERVPAFTPREEDYRALIMDLLLYRQETLTPVVAALRAEREGLEKRMGQLQQLVAELHDVRADIVKLVKTERTASEAMLATVVEELAWKDRGNSGGGQTSNSEGSSGKHTELEAQSEERDSEEFML